VGISITECTVIFLVALLLFGPEQLPVLARTIGKLSGQVRRTSDSLRRELYNSVYTPGEDVKNALNGELKSLRALKAEVLAPPTGAIGSSSRPTQTVQAVESSPEGTTPAPASSQVSST
jgi:Sec-independent protein translocase protein TatA